MEFSHKFSIINSICSRCEVLERNHAISLRWFWGSCCESVKMPYFTTIDHVDLLGRWRKKQLSNQRLDWFEHNASYEKTLLDRQLRLCCYSRFTRYQLGWSAKCAIVMEMLCDVTASAQLNFRMYMYTGLRAGPSACDHACINAYFSRWW